jgi:hypothetical protein
MARTNTLSSGARNRCHNQVVSQKALTTNEFSNLSVRYVELGQPELLDRQCSLTAGRTLRHETFNRDRNDFAETLLHLLQHHQNPNAAAHRCVSEVELTHQTPTPSI